MVSFLRARFSKFFQKYNNIITHLSYKLKGRGGIIRFSVFPASSTVKTYKYLFLIGNTYAHTHIHTK